MKIRKGSKFSQEQIKEIRNLFSEGLKPLQIFKKLNPQNTDDWKKTRGPCREISDIIYNRKYFDSNYRMPERSQGENNLNVFGDALRNFLGLSPLYLHDDKDTKEYEDGLRWFNGTYLWSCNPTGMTSKFSGST